MFLIAKRAEEDSPWAIIMNEVPYIPKVENDIVPAIRRPMCPTEE